MSGKQIEGAFEAGGWVPISLIAERIGRDKSVVSKRARKDRVGTVRPLETAGGVKDCLGVPGEWANGLLERYRTARANAEALA